MSEKYQLPSESDEDDVDYIPERQCSASEEESDVDKECEVDEGDFESRGNVDIKVQKRCKRRKNQISKRLKTHEMPLSRENLLDEVVENDNKIIVLNDEEQKKRADSLWADFLKDSAVLSKSKCTSDSSISAKLNTCSVKSEIDDKIKITKTFEFSGEKLEIEKEIFVNSTETRRSISKSENTRNNISSVIEKNESKGRVARRVGMGGISAVLGRLDKKTKINTLEKSKMDWDNFKKQEDIEEEINSHNRGKEGYLEKQDFLQRTDFRQFEIEKQLRNASRRSNR